MGPKEQALKDIKAELRREHKPFISFNTALNPIMKELVKHTLLMQKKGKKK